METMLREMCHVLFAWWWYGKDGQTKTANVSDQYVLPVVLVVSVVCLIAMLVWWK